MAARVGPSSGPSAAGGQAVWSPEDKEDTHDLVNLGLGRFDVVLIEPRLLGTESLSDLLGRAATPDEEGRVRSVRVSLRSATPERSRRAARLSASCRRPSCMLSPFPSPAAGKGRLHAHSLEIGAGEDGADAGAQGVGVELREEGGGAHLSACDDRSLSADATDGHRETYSRP
jgi:hypothetical protein